MNRKIYIIIITTILIFVIVGIFYYMFVHQNQQITPEDAEKLCASVLGEKDKETGFTFSFGFTETIQKEGKKYHVIRASWLVNNSHMSYIGDFFVSVDGKEIYDGFVSSNEYKMEKLIWSK